MTSHPTRIPVPGALILGTPGLPVTDGAPAGAGFDALFPPMHRPSCACTKTGQNTLDPHRHNPFPTN